jgi:serine protease AprX
MWYYSSRGPGQYYAQPDTEQKPDVTAPTPRNGLIVYGDSMRVLPNGWGTSGACPQISGLAALMLSKDPTLNYTEVFEKIRNNATGLGLNYNCQGAGLINVASTVNAV